jgi:hypothetical protein
MGQVLTKTIKFEGKINFVKLMDKVVNMPNVFDIRRKAYLAKNKFVLNFAYKDMVVENTGLFRTTSFARFQTVFNQVEPNLVQLATEYGFIGSASNMALADKMNDIIAKYLNESRSNVVDAEDNDVPTPDSDFISSADNLLKAKELYDRGAISSDEYERLKNKFMEDALR